MTQSTANSVPYFVPCLEQCKWALTAAILPHFLHLVIHLLGESQCTKTDLFPVKEACGEYEVDMIFHLAEGILQISVGLCRLKKQPFLASCTLALGLASTFVFADITLSEASPFRQPHGMLLNKDPTKSLADSPVYLPTLILALFGHIWPITVFCTDLKIGFAMHASLMLPAYSYGATGNIALGSVTQILMDGLLICFLGGNMRMSWDDSLMYWRKQQTGAKSPCKVMSHVSRDRSYSMKSAKLLD